ncbi:UPF0758 domain-containing protein [Pedobacter aquatilis]|uniref:UPF0758 domain-containing protein n=1 Tax=Pedobacter aquatilis TaxID=351343 RepID=UPI00292EC452|nr:UPF0758 domain-containing protein [Pedobacter aquatilis]
MQNRTIAAESFSSGKRNFFLDFKIAKNKTDYISIARSDEQADGSYRRKSIIIFQEDFEFMISAFSSLFHVAAYAKEGEKSVLNLFEERKADKDAKGIKAMQPEMRPREKFLKYGPGILSDAELIAMLIGSGTPEVTAVDLAQKILDANQKDLRKISKLSHKELAKFLGMGLAKSSAILAAMELGKRVFSLEAPFRFIKGKKPTAVFK